MMPSTFTSSPSRVTTAAGDLNLTPCVTQTFKTAPGLPTNAFIKTLHREGAKNAKAKPFLCDLCAFAVTLPKAFTSNDIESY
jgi:hypothetical protein